MSRSTHFTVVRNKGYGSTEFKTRQRHNERQNENYYNGDIVPERSILNHHYQRYMYPDGTPETYEDSFNRLVSTGEIVKRGLRPDAKVFAELVFDVNTAYFEEHSGYKYARDFFDEAYKLAVKEVGDERYILSAVMHADERNSALSKEYGRDIFHYHLHVVYVPVVKKEVYYRKDMKDKEKAGKLKEIIPQISHSKKWPIKVQVERDGKSYMVNSYSLLQDRYFEHMKAAGFEGFERGERGSTAEHLDVVDFKIMKDSKKLEDLQDELERAEDELDELDAEAERKENKIEKLDEQIKVKSQAKATIAEINAMGKPAMLGGYNVTEPELKKLKTLAKKSVTADERARKKVESIEKELAATRRSLSEMIRDRDYWRNKFIKLEATVKPYLFAIYNFPKELSAFIERKWQERSRHKVQSQGVER